MLDTSVYMCTPVTKFVHAISDDDDDVPPSKFEDEHELRLNLRLTLRALGIFLLDPIVLI